jgi:hypothetical protein
MKKLITMLLAMGLLALLSLGTVAYADEGGKGDGKNGNGDNGEKDHKKVVLCIEKDHEFKLIEVKKDDLEKYLEDDAFFPKAKVVEEDKDKAIVKFLCDFKDNGNNGNNFEHVKVLLCQEKDHEFKLIEVKKDDLEKYLEDDAFFPKAKVVEEDKDKVIVKFLCDFKDDKDDKKVIYLFQADKDDNGDKNGKDEKKNDYAAIGMRQTALAV